MIPNQPDLYPSYGPDAFFVAGLATATADTPIAVQYDKLLVVLIVERSTGVILDAECNMVLDVTGDFIASLFVGRCFYTDLEGMIADVCYNYQGINQRALVVCLRDAYAKMIDRATFSIPHRKA